MLIEDMIHDCGGRVLGPTAQFDQALELARAAGFDVAILDLNLAGRLTYPIAEAIRARGLPLIFATGYAAQGILDAFKNCPILAKPFTRAELEAALMAVCPVPLSKVGGASAADQDLAG
jgi:CheY-like chemotaxis protein